MNLFVFFSSFFVLQKNYNKKLLGDDERFIYHPDQFNENITLAKIIYLNNIQTKIDLLSSNDVSVLRKLDQLELDQLELDKKLAPVPFNVLRGGLLNDWNFDFPIE
jgi:hypothetical protein